MRFPRWRVKARVMRSALAVVMLAVGVAGVLGGGSPARASHVVGAVYTGIHSKGGTVEFQVSADWKTITRFKFLRVPITLFGAGTCYLTVESTSPAGGIPISHHGFSYQATEGARTTSFSGSFATSRQATGSFQAQFSTLICGSTISVGALTSGQLTWTASTTASSPPPSRPVLSGPSAQRVGTGKVVVLAGCGMPCTLTATGTVSGAARVFPLRKATASLDNPGQARLTLAISGSARRAIKQALAEGKRVSANVAVKASFDSGVASATRRVRLVR